LIIRLLAEGVGVVVSTPYMDEAIRCTRLGFMVAGRLLATGSPRDLVAPFAGRVLELKAGPRRTAQRICQADPGVEYVATYGEMLRMHLRGWTGTAQPEEEIKARLSRALADAGVRVDSLRAIAPSLEDVFISTLQGTTLQETTLQGTTGEAPHG
jgi:ABC-2 type transport system ATP-binding protein